MTLNRSALLDRGAEEVATGKLAAAERTYRTILADEPQDAEALSNLAAVLNGAECHEAAEAACRASLQAQPGYWAALANLGAALHRQQRYEEAVTAYSAAIEANPANAKAFTNLGVALNEQWRMTESLRAHEAAVALAPNDPEIRNNRALALLIAGDLAQGFAEMEWRWRTPSMKPHGVPGPLWLGEAPRGRTILLHDEAGFGDTLQFVRYAPLVAERGARVVLQVQAPLVSLVRRSMPEVANVFARGEALPAYDLQCPLVSLPHAFNTTLQTVPAGVPYLHPDPATAAQWRARLEASRTTPGLLVGLVWAGASRPDMPQAMAMDRRRSMTLAHFAPFASVPNIRFVSLQLGTSPERTPPGMAILDPMASMQSFDDTAALVANLDLVITVDTSVAHLAGALGRPVWVLSRHDACWRWLAGEQSSPWYPQLRFYRQPGPGDWASVILEVTDDLKEYEDKRKKNLLF